MDMTAEIVGSWAKLTHQRFLLRRAAGAFQKDPEPVLSSLQQIVRLCALIGARRLETVAALARKRLSLLHGEGSLDRRIVYELVDAVDRAYAEALAHGVRGDPSLAERSS